MQHVRTVGVVALAAVVFVAAVVWPASFAAAADRHVGMGDVSFDPKTITVVPGDRVVWTNNSTRAHTVTADDGRFNQPVPPGGTFAFTFAQAGSVPYHCEIHAGAGMTGTVNVQGQATTTTAAPATTTTTARAATPTTSTTAARATTTSSSTSSSTTVEETTTSSSTPPSTTSTTEVVAADDDRDGDDDGGGLPVVLLVLALLAVLGAGGYGLWRLWPRPSGPPAP